MALDRFGSHCPRGATGRATVSYTGGCSFESSRGRCRTERDDADVMHWRVDREERCSLAKRWPRATSPAFDPLPLRPGRYASLAGAPCFENSDTALPWGFDTSTFRTVHGPVGPAVGRPRPQLSERRFESCTGHDRPETRTPVRPVGSPPGCTAQEAGDALPRGGTGRDPAAPRSCGVAQRESGWPLTTVVGGSMPSSAALAP